MNIIEKAASEYITFQAHMPSGYLEDALKEAREGSTNEIKFWLQMDEDSTHEEDEFEFENVDPEAVLQAVLAAINGKATAQIRAASNPSYAATFAGYLAA